MHKESQFSIIPAVRISDKVKPEIKLYSTEADLAAVRIMKNNVQLKKYIFALENGIVKSEYFDISAACGDITIRVEFIRDEKVVYSEDYPYQVVNTSLTSTTLIDGCWIDIYHWSEEEGKYFNKGLKQMHDEDYARMIRDMHSVGIDGVIIQSVFENNCYCNCHNIEEEGYKGQSYYPSKLYDGRIDITAKNPIEAVLSAADECGMHVLIGIGNYAWFDFTKGSLEWHKKVAKEIFELFGHHKSFYGWYISEEIFGALYAEWDKVPYEDYKNIGPFFREFRKYVKQFTPTKPVALAPNNINFHHYEREWQTILPFIDILLPFAFARDLEHLNILDIKRMCEECDTHMWVDMEVFENPFPDGLIPKKYDDLIKEIRIYDDLEQNYGYEYTGMLTHPDFPYDLGGEKAVDLYNKYKEYYDNFMAEQNAKNK